MGWRVIVVSTRCKLDYSMNYMVIRSVETRRILLDEKSIIILENNSISMTGCLLSELINKKIKVVLCDDKRNPQAEMIPYYGAHNDALRIKQQIGWKPELGIKIWTEIVRAKIYNQAQVLDKFNRKAEASLLLSYVDELKDGDISNREGHAAKVYFNAVFGMDFKRDDGNDFRNLALNYGYTLILSAFNREIVANGYLTQLGLCHDNQFNHFNLSCDLMEPFRTLVDLEVINHDYIKFDKEEKHEMIKLLNKTVRISGMEHIITNAIKIYTKSIFDALNEEKTELIKHIEI